VADFQTPPRNTVPTRNSSRVFSNNSAIPIDSCPVSANCTSRPGRISTRCGSGTGASLSAIRDRSSGTNVLRGVCGVFATSPSAITQTSAGGIGKEISRHLRRRRRGHRHRRGCNAPIRYANQAASGMLGYAPGELQALGIRDIHPESDVQDVLVVFDAMARGELKTAVCTPCLRKDGTVFQADVFGLYYYHDGIPCNVGFFVDVTERNRAEEKSGAVLRRKCCRPRSSKVWVSSPVVLLTISTISLWEFLGTRIWRSLELSEIVSRPSHARRYGYSGTPRRRPLQTNAGLFGKGRFWCGPSTLSELVTEMSRCFKCRYPRRSCCATICMKDCLPWKPMQPRCSR